MKTTFLRRIAAFSVAVLATATLLTGCSENEEKDYLYTLNLEEYSYSGSGSGSSLLGPMEYLSTLGITERFTLHASDANDADSEAEVRFEAEMSRIDPQALSRYGKYYFRYVLTSAASGKTLAEKEFGSK